MRKELIRPDRPLLPAEDGFRFCHLLIRDAAYDALPKATRAELHERFADWLDEHGGELVERDEIVGYHLEQAYRYRDELGDPERARRGRSGSGRPASSPPPAAARRSAATTTRSPTCSNARCALGVRRPARAAAAPGRARPWRSTRPGGSRRPRRCSTATVEAATEPRGTRPGRSRARSRLAQRLRFGSDGRRSGGRSRSRRRRSGRSRRSATRSGWPRPSGCSAARSSARGRSTESLAAARARARSRAGRRGDRHPAAGHRPTLASDLADGPMPVDEAIGRLEELLAASRDDRVLEAVISRAARRSRSRWRAASTRRARTSSASAPVLDERRT